MSPDPGVVGVLLAGGQSRRMGGGDKCLRPLGGKPILEQIMSRVANQVGRLIINANGDPGRFARYGLPVVADIVTGHAGPLAGVLTGMTWALEYAPSARYVATFPTDAPFLPKDLVVRLSSALSNAGADLACAASAGRDHPVVGLWPVALREDLEQAMTVDAVRKVDVWTARHRLVSVEFSADPIDPFFNTNRPEDLDAAERLLTQVGAP